MELTELLQDKEMIWITGKGGVGKSTLSGAISLHFAGNGSYVLTKDVDPAHSMPDTFGIKVPSDNVVHQVYEDLASLHLMLITPEKIIAEIEKGRAEHKKNRAEGLPGYQEILHLYDVVGQLGVLTAMQELTQLNAMTAERRKVIDTYENTHIICDLEPSNGTLKLLKQAEYAIERIGVMGKNRTRWGLIARAAGWPDIARFAQSSDYIKNIGSYQQAFKEFNEAIHDPEKTAFVVVCSPEDSVLKETTRLKHSLDRLGLPVAAIVFNKDYSHLDQNKVQGTPLEHIPELHRRNVDRYMTKLGFDGAYFSIPFVPDLEVKHSLAEKRPALKEYMNSMIPLR